MLVDGESGLRRAARYHGPGREFQPTPSQSGRLANRQRQHGFHGLQSQRLALICTRCFQMRLLQIPLAILDSFAAFCTTSHYGRLRRWARCHGHRRLSPYCRYRMRSAQLFSMQLVQWPLLIVLKLTIPRSEDPWCKLMASFHVALGPTFFIVAFHRKWRH